MSFINKYSVYCLLGPQSKDYKLTHNTFSWKVNKKQHFTLIDKISNNDINYIKLISPSNFHYLSEDSVKELSKHFKINKTKENSVEIKISDLSFSGTKYKSIRNSYNKCKKLNLTIQDNFNKIEDIKNFIDQWSTDSADKYFRDNSGKNLHFFKSNFHKDCTNLFIYDQSKLIAVAVASPLINNYTSYVLGKALCIKYPGLSEFADIELYKKLLTLNNNDFTINLGQTSKGMTFYKMKFPNANKTIHFNGNIL